MRSFWVDYSLGFMRVAFDEPPQKRTLAEAPPEQPASATRDRSRTFACSQCWIASIGLIPVIERRHEAIVETLLAPRRIRQHETRGARHAPQGRETARRGSARGRSTQAPARGHDVVVVDDEPIRIHLQLGIATAKLLREQPVRRRATAAKEAPTPARTNTPPQTAATTAPSECFSPDPGDAFGHVAAPDRCNLRAGQDDDRGRPFISSIATRPSPMRDAHERTRARGLFPRHRVRIREQIREPVNARGLRAGVAHDRRPRAVCAMSVAARSLSLWSIPDARAPRYLDAPIKTSGSAHMTTPFDVYVSRDRAGTRRLPRDRRASRSVRRQRRYPLDVRRAGAGGLHRGGARPLLATGARGVDLSVQSAADWEKGVRLYKAFDIDAGVRDVDTTVEAARTLTGANGRVGVMGFCLGGLLTYLTAARTSIDAAVAFHGGRTEEFLDEAADIDVPFQVHLAADDEFIPPTAQQAIAAALANHPNAEVHSYAGCKHAFSRHGGLHYEANAALSCPGNARSTSSGVISAHELPTTLPATSHQE